MLRPTMLALALALLGASPAGSAQNRVEGVNPADLLTQLQFTAEYNRIDSGLDQWAFTGKYDYRIPGTSVGLNFELPLYVRLDGPGFSSNGNGDFFSRARYIRTIGQWSLGGAIEVVAPLGSDDFSTGRWQTNPALLAVYAWNPQDITALVHKRFFGYIEGDADRGDINQYQWRALQIHIFPSGWYAQLDVARFEDVLDDRDWFDSRVSVGKQISATQRLQAELRKFSGDVSNDFALSVSYAVKL
jgi:hypothetical protein